jgi:hypothetical protein
LPTTKVRGAARCAADTVKALLAEAKKVLSERERDMLTEVSTGTPQAKKK